MRMLDSDAGVPGLLINLTATPHARRTTAGTATPIVKISLAPETQLLTDMPWNIAWPSGKPRWRHESRSCPTGDLLLVSDTSTTSVAAVGVVGIAPPESAAAFKISAAAALSTGLGARGHAASTAYLPLAANGTTTISLFVVLGNSSAVAARHAEQLNTPHAFQMAWVAAQKRWEERWVAAFTPGNLHFSGSLPTIEVLEAPLNSPEDDNSTEAAAAVARIYYSGVVTLLACERTNYPVVSQRVYVTGFGTMQPFMGTSAFHGGSAAFYWDQSLLSSLNSLLDPIWMRDFLLVPSRR